MKIGSAIRRVDKGRYTDIERLSHKPAFILFKRYNEDLLKIMYEVSVHVLTFILKV
jgi:hypothetical protein